MIAFFAVLKFFCQNNMAGNASTANPVSMEKESQRDIIVQLIRLKVKVHSTQTVNTAAMDRTVSFVDFFILYNRLSSRVPAFS